MFEMAQDAHIGCDHAKHACILQEERYSNRIRRRNTGRGVNARKLTAEGRGRALGLTDVTVNKPFSDDAPIPHNKINALKQIPLSNPKGKA